MDFEAHPSYVTPSPFLPQKWLYSEAPKQISENDEK